MFCSFFFFSHHSGILCFKRGSNRRVKTSDSSLKYSHNLPISPKEAIFSDAGRFHPGSYFCQSYNLLYGPQKRISEMLKNLTQAKASAEYLSRKSEWGNS